MHVATAIIRYNSYSNMLCVHHGTKCESYNNIIVAKKDPDAVSS